MPTKPNKTDSLVLRDNLAQAAEKLLANWPTDTTLEIGVAGESGSAGKTTVCNAWAALLAMHGFEVEIVDLDGQGNSSKQHGIGVSERPDDNLLDLSLGLAPPLMLGDVLLEREVYVPGEGSKRRVSVNDVRRCAYNPTKQPGYGVIVDDDNPLAEETIAWLKRIKIYPNGDSYASGMRRTFYDDQQDLSTHPSGMGGALLGIEMDKADTTPHIRFYDLHGTKSIVMYSALVRLKRVFGCVLLDDKSTGTDLDNFQRTINQIRDKFNPELMLSMIAISHYEMNSIRRGPRAQFFEDRLRERFGPIVPDVRIRRVNAPIDAYWAREPLPMWEPDDPVNDDYRRLLLWAIENNVLDPTPNQT